MPTDAVYARSLSFDFLMEEQRLVVDRLAEVWRQYMSWFSFAFTSNLLALSWVGINREYLQRIDDGSLRTPALLFSAMWILLDLLNLAGSVMMGRHTRTVGLRAELLCAQA